jgi:hypothetical protein
VSLSVEDSDWDFGTVILFLSEDRRKRRLLSLESFWEISTDWDGLFVGFVSPDGRKTMNGSTERPDFDDSEVWVQTGIGSRGKQEERRICSGCGFPGILFRWLFGTGDLLFLGLGGLTSPSIYSDYRWLAFWQIGEPKCRRHDGCYFEEIEVHVGLLLMKWVSANEIAEIFPNEIDITYAPAPASLRIALRAVMDGSVGLLH